MDALARTDAGAFSANIVHFARALRRAGLPVGSDRVLTAVAAIDRVGVARRDDVQAALAAVMLDRHEQQALFDAAFDAFWRDPMRLESLLVQALAGAGGGPAGRAPAAAGRLAAAFAPPPAAVGARDAGAADVGARDARAVAARPAASDRERLQGADFASMTTEEFRLAKRLADGLPLPVQPVQRRRHERAARGTLDLRASLLRMARQPELVMPSFTRPRREMPALVVLLDISGSMDRYARLLLHYVHGLTRRHVQVHTFTFGTRLTNITRSLRHRDPDVALQRADAQVSDWNGGTRIASCLADFNRHWARRVLGSGAALLLVTDGLDRDDGGDLARAAAQLRRFAAQIVWLNPLLRFDAFEPRAAGIRALLPHVDRLLPMHNLASLADLGRALRTAATGPSPTRRRPTPSSS